MTARDVHVVRRDDGVWNAFCISELCGSYAGHYSHDVYEGDSRAAAQRAATGHRRELRRIQAERDAPPHCDACGQRLPRGGGVT
ncbi:hypothetical protein [Thermomonospora umbrina]|uniref:Uncharacterized protein n=1 Tax=Thermomonospora umbrina TaxID=111806 RepID=A0A3D9T6I9_9ACTN|nr:hypothetical protein [Thermomonospora umbrina]REF00275.1 hypothetical protein DFJ69_5804 [Thermomonospora umbrina]